MPTPLAADHSWYGTGLISIDNQPAANGLISLLPEQEFARSAPTTLNPAQRMNRPHNHRLTGWRIELLFSDVTEQVRALSEQGSAAPLTLVAKIDNQANSQLAGAELQVQAQFVPTHSLLPAVVGTDQFAQITLLAYATVSPVTQWTTNND